MFFMGYYILKIQVGRHIVKLARISEKKCWETHWRDAETRHISQKSEGAMPPSAALGRWQVLGLALCKRCEGASARRCTGGQRAVLEITQAVCVLSLPLCVSVIYILCLLKEQVPQ